MHLLAEELAREHVARRLAEADHERVITAARHLRRAQRMQRRANRARRRAAGALARASC